MSQSPEPSNPLSTAPPPPEDPTLVNTLRQHGPGRLVFERFRLVRELGAGGMAVVWLASDERLGLEVALKFLPGMVASDPEALHDLRREITRGLRLTHPGIVRVYDLHENSGDGLAAIAMEYVDGSTLTDEKARQPDRCFDVAEPLLSWTRDLCGVLGYVHEKARVVHRDLKPRNLMLTAGGDLKVADFGIAATLSDSHSRLTQHPGTSGTPVYMSPQQAIGRNPSAADDIYAVGATLYELLTSKPPFFRGSMAVILNQVSTQTPPGLAERRAEFGITDRRTIPARWEETIAACLAKEPEDRPKSVREIAERLGLLERALPAPPGPQEAADEQPTVPATPIVRVSPSPPQHQTAPAGATPQAEPAPAKPADGVSSVPTPAQPAPSTPTRPVPLWAWALVAGAPILAAKIELFYIFGIGSSVLMPVAVALASFFLWRRKSVALVALTSVAIALFLGWHEPAQVMTNAEFRKILADALVIRENPRHPVRYHHRWLGTDYLDGYYNPDLTAPPKPFKLRVHAMELPDLYLFLRLHGIVPSYVSTGSQLHYSPGSTEIPYPKLLELLERGRVVHDAQHPVRLVRSPIFDTYLTGTYREEEGAPAKVFVTPVGFLYPDKEEAFRRAGITLQIE